MVSEPEPPAHPARPRPGAITLARHAEPALSRRIRLNADGYRRWWAAYEEGGILPDQTPPGALRAAAEEARTTFVSTRRRAQETAQQVATGRVLAPDAVFIEAPLPPPPLPAFIRLKPRTWGFIARFVWWWFNHHEGQESQREATVRAAAAAGRLTTAAADGDVLLVAHGFFNLMIGLALQKRGWTLVEKTGFGYWSMRRYEPGRNAALPAGGGAA